MYITSKNDGSNKPLELHWECLKCQKEHRYVDNSLRNGENFRCKYCGYKHILELRLIEQK